MSHIVDQASILLRSQAEALSVRASEVRDLAEKLHQEARALESRADTLDTESSTEQQDFEDWYDKWFQRRPVDNQRAADCELAWNAGYLAGVERSRRVTDN